MPNVAEAVRNTMLSASMMMPGAVVDQPRQFNTSSPLPQGGIELRINTLTRIDRTNPVIEVFNAEASPSASPSFEPSPIPSVEPSLDPNASPIPPEECPPDGQPPIAAIDGTGTVPVTPAPNTEASPSSGPDESLPPSDLSSNTGTDDTGLPPTDTDGDGIIDGDVDGDGDVDENDETAVVDPCEPKPSLTPTPVDNTQATIATLNSILDQENNTVRGNITSTQIDGAHTNLWSKFKSDLTIVLPDHEKLSKKLLKKYYLTDMFDPSLGSTRGGKATYLISALFYAYNKSTNPAAREAIKEFTDLVYDYAASIDLPGQNKEQERSGLNELVRGRLIPWLTEA